MARVLRVLALLLGSSLVIGGTLRSWGQGRPLAFVIDDYLIGGGLIVAALWFRAESLRRRAAFAAAWGDTTGAGFQSNIPDDLLTWLIGTAYATSLFGMIATIALREPRSS